MATGDILDIARFLKDSRISESKIRFASKEEDMVEHWDFKVILKDGSEQRIDIKSLKKLDRYDDVFNDQLHWVELKNVHGNTGWVQGKADFIIFECFAEWLLVSRSKLEAYALEKTANGRLLHTKDYVALQNGDRYQRKDRKDEMTLITLNELLSLNPKRVVKQHEKRVLI
jgi:hypothetical protein